MIAQIIFYIQPFVIAFSLSSVFCWAIIKVVNTFFHDKIKIPRFGGIAVIGAFIVGLYLNKYLVFDQTVWAMIIGGIAILIFGVIDDVMKLRWQSQLFAQITVVLLVFIIGVRITSLSNILANIPLLEQFHLSIFSLLFILVWMLVMMNAVNWSDGLDGLSAGVVLIASVAIFIIALKPNVMQPPIAIITSVFAGSILGFLVFNFPPAKIFIGSSGAFFMGFIVAMLAIVAGVKIGTTLLVLIVPLVDAIWVVVERIKKGQSIFKGDKRHLHHRLLDRGWSAYKILTLYYSFTLVCAVLAVITHDIGKIMTILVFAFLIAIFFGIISIDTKKYDFQ